MKHIILWSALYQYHLIKLSIFRSTNIFCCMIKCLKMLNGVYYKWNLILLFILLFVMHTELLQRYYSTSLIT